VLSTFFFYKIQNAAATEKEINSILAETRTTLIKRVLGQGLELKIGYIDYFLIVWSERP